MKIFKSTTSTFTFGEYQDGKQVCLVPGGRNKKGGDKFVEIGQETNVSKEYKNKWFIEITFQNYLNAIER